VGGPQSRPGRGGEEENSCPCQEPNSGHQARSLVSKLIGLPRHLSHGTEGAVGYVCSFHVSIENVQTICVIHLTTGPMKVFESLYAHRMCDWFVFISSCFEVMMLTCLYYTELMRNNID
jgi:hypothetical protein